MATVDLSKIDSERIAEQFQGMTQVEVQIEQICYVMSYEKLSPVDRLALLTQLRTISQQELPSSNLAETLPIHKLKNVLTSVMSTVLTQMANGAIGRQEDAELSRYMLLEVGWVLINLAYFTGNIIEALVHHDDMYEESPESSLLYLTAQVITKFRDDLQMID